MKFLKKLLKRNKKLYGMLVHVYVIFINRSRIGVSYIFCFFSIKNNQVVMSNHAGKGFGDSPKYIAENLYKKDSSFKIYWLTDSISNEKFPDFVIPIKNTGLKSLFIMATSKFWIDNTRKTFYPHKRKKQIYIQTWHGLLPLKSIEKDAENYLPKEYIQIAKKDSLLCDYILSGAEFNTQIYLNSFWFYGEILEFGTPRTDVLFNGKTNLKSKVYNFFALPSDKKIILYAPTFRVNTKLSEYLLDVRKVLEFFKQKLSERYILMIRLHPNVASSSGFFVYSNEIINATDYPDIQELLVVSDFLITDYSSSMFDMLLLNKPCFLFVKDLQKYLKEERPLNFSIEDLPFPQAVDEYELFSIIEKFSKNEYLKNIKEFKGKTGIFEDGKASDRITDFIMSNRV